MFMMRRYSRYIALPMIGLMLALTMPMGVANAALVGTDQAIDRAAADAERVQVIAFLARADVRQGFQSMGVDADEAAGRVAAMSDSEIHQVALRMEQLPAGQGVAEALIGAALLIFIILLITDLIGVTDIFPFVKGGKARK